MKTAAQVRAEFLAFFEEKEHRIVPSAPVFPQDDPTLLFCNAGMNQFKDVFLGTGRRDYTRAADSQKCIRVSGKHNDLEEVGVDTYHHTFFEMLGNWSFGDYFKREAIAWAWELLTERWGLPKDRLWVTIFEGDAQDGTQRDDEAAKLWAEVTDIRPDRILEGNKDDNFWEMGDTGPCGPCTEIHLDRGGPDTDPEDGRNPAIGVNAESERFIELWNLVFIQHNRQPDGSLVDLPSKHVDTGMGFERVLSVLQGKNSNYDTDLFTPIFDAITDVTGRPYRGTDEPADVAFRVIADHLRALTAALSDGALPSNEGRGYVLRRLLRRAARFGRQALEQSGPFLHRVVPTVVEVLGDAFPEMRAQADHVAHVVHAEEKAFGLTLDKGLVRFANLVKGLEGKTIPGGEAYDLYATYGFPQDLVELMARERDLEVDSAGWAAAESAHKSASKGAGSSGYVVAPSAVEGLSATERVCWALDGNDGITATAKPLRLIENRALVLDRTPFYPESGGQVGDTGVIEGQGFRFRVTDVQKLGEQIIHLGALEVGSADALPAEACCAVDAERRTRIMANHTATHLLHYALKRVLGEHANQQGSLVAPDRLRFDLTHPKAITPEQVEEIERLVNEKVAADRVLDTTIESLDDAKERGVTALFGEKYDDEVRVVTIDEDSMELCGGTHCRATGQIGAFAVLAESAVQAGVRRIEAVTRDAAIARFQEQRRTLREASQALKVAETELPARIAALQKKLKELEKGGAQQSQSDLAAQAKALLESAESVGSAKIVRVAPKGLGAKQVSLLCDALKAAGPGVCGVLGLVDGKKVILAAFASKDLAGKTVHAGNLVRELAAIVGGGGGGRPDFAQAGGKDPSRLDEALDLGVTRLREALGA